MKFPIAIRILGLYGITIGLAAVLTNYFSSQVAGPISVADPVQATVQQAQQQVTNPRAFSTSSEEAVPNKLVIDSLSLTLSVKPGLYNAETKEWTLDDDSAFYATTSRKINNQNGTTVIYGHDRASVFEALGDIKVGDKVKVFTEDNREFVYSYRSDKRVTPESVNVLYEPSTTPQLVLLTCDGVWSDVRRVMYFDLKEVYDV